MFAPVALLACVAALGGCGGGSDESTTSASTATQSAQAGEPGAVAEGTGTGKAGKGRSGGGAASKGSAGGNGSGGGSKEGSGGSAGVERASSFKVKGGDNSIQEFGEEGGGSERSEATKALKALFDAYRSGNWETVCTNYLSANNLKEIELLGEKSPQVKGKSCPEILAGLNPSSERTPDTPAGGVAAIRREGELAFALYRGIDGKGYAIPMKMEHGGWKLTALAATPLEF